MVLGTQAGFFATDSSNITFIGSSAGFYASGSSNSTFIGYQAGNLVTGSINSTFIGYQAGNKASSSVGATLVGYQAGANQSGINYSTFFGYLVGNNNNSTGLLGVNNIIIGTNITVSSSMSNQINIGGLIFGSGSYGTVGGNPSSGSANGSVGINQPNPKYTLDVSGSVNGTTYNVTNGIVPQEQYMTFTSSYTLTNSTALQKIFGGTPNGMITLATSSLYFFECILSVTNMSATTGNASFNILGSGSVLLASASWVAYGSDTTTPATAATISGIYVNAISSSTNIITASTGTGMYVYIKGSLRTKAGGTLQPSLGLTSANAAIVDQQSYFKIYQAGTGSGVGVGIIT